VPRVSVIVPCYNHGRYVDEAVQSILSQTYQDTEIIVVNDGSTDSFTTSLLREYTRTRTRVIQSENLGPSAARNKGIAESSGEYILNLDADDTFRPGFLEKAVAILDSRQDIGMVSCWAQTHGQYDIVLEYEGGGVLNALLGKASLANCLFRRECWERVGGYDTSFRTGCEDTDFCIGVAGLGWQIHCIPEVLMDYRKAKGSRCDTASMSRPEHTERLVSKHLGLFREHVVEVLRARDLEIKRCEHLIESIYESPRYKIGGLFAVPFAQAVALVRRFGGGGRDAR
jgi:glycosyltransferase involved in cell wall biosynthesis